MLRSLLSINNPAWLAHLTLALTFLLLHHPAVIKWSFSQCYHHPVSVILQTSNLPACPFLAPALIPMHCSQVVSESSWVQPRLTGWFELAKGGLNKCHITLVIGVKGLLLCTLFSIFVVYILFYLHFFLFCTVTTFSLRINTVLSYLIVNNRVLLQTLIHLLHSWQG